MDLRKIRTNPDAEIGGVWFDSDDMADILGVDVDSAARIKIARAGNQKATKLSRKLMRETYGKRRLDPDKVAEELMSDPTIRHQVLAEAIIVDWKGFTNGGEPYPYTVDNALEWLKASSDFEAMVNDFSGRTQRYRDEDIEDAEKN